MKQNEERKNSMLNPEKIKKGFPLLQKKINGKPLVYLDSAASSQKPQQVIDAITHYYSTSHANIHRGIHSLGQQATLAYEASHKATASFINAASWREIIFTKNATESLNLVAYSLCQTFAKGDEILVSQAEHHSNFVPWQQCAQLFGLVLKIIPLTKEGALDIKALQHLLSKKTKVVALSHISNVLGTVNDIKNIATLVHANKTKTEATLLVVDGAQSVPHMPIDVQNLDCDFLAFSSHKMLGPTGIGILYGKKALLEKMPPFLFGGGMVGNVEEKQTTWADLPWKFEAGTPHIAGAVGFHAALDYLQQIGMENVWKHDTALAAYAIKKLKQQKDIIIYGSPTEKRSGVVTFTINNIHPHDIAAILDQEGIAVRAGHHCCQILHQHLKIPASVRLSSYVYTTTKDIDALIVALEKVRKVFLQ